MEWDKLGEVMKTIRKQNKLTQAELAQGICTQAQISKYENGQEIPSSITLYYLAKKLDVNMEYILNYISSPRPDYIEEVILYIRENIRKKEYKEVFEMVNAEFRTPLIKDKEYFQFLLWHKGICTYHVLNDRNKAISILNDALMITNDKGERFSKRELEILNSIGIIYYESLEYEQSFEIQIKALEGIKDVTMKKDITILIRLLYNISRTTLALNNLEKTIIYCKKGIDLCLKNETFYLLGELYYQIGRCYKRLDDEKAIKYFNKSIAIFQLEHKPDYEKVVYDALDEFVGDHMNHLSCYNIVNNNKKLSSKQEITQFKYLY